MANAETISISCGSVGQELQLCREGAEAWAKDTGHQVNLVSTPTSSSERLALYQQLLAAGDTDIDVLQIDVIWPGILATHLVDLKEYAEDVVGDHSEPIVENNTIGDRLVAMPWFTDAGILYYRKDLLEEYGEKVPTTWEQLTETAKKIQDGERKKGKTRMWGYVWQGHAYEGLTCNALEWVASYNGDTNGDTNGVTIVDKAGKVTINNPNAVAALEQAASWIGEITPQEVLNYQEEEARHLFQDGNAVFMRNWPYAWALVQSLDSPVKDKVGVTVLPKGGKDGRHTGALGGWQLAVSRYSRHPEIAADLVMYLTSAKEQKRRAMEGAFIPTRPSLYKDQEIQADIPFLRELEEVFKKAVPRPSSVVGSRYNEVSKEFWDATRMVLSGRSSAEDSLAQLEGKLNRMSHGGRRWDGGPTF